MLFNKLVVACLLFGCDRATKLDRAAGAKTSPDAVKPSGAMSRGYSFKLVAQNQGLVCKPREKFSALFEIVGNTADDQPRTVIANIYSIKMIVGSYRLERSVVDDRKTNRYQLQATAPESPGHYKLVVEAYRVTPPKDANSASTRQKFESKPFDLGVEK